MASTCGSSHDGILIVNTIGPVAVQGNVIANNETNILAYNASNLTVTGNYLYNPQGALSCANSNNLNGNQFQAWADDATPNSNIVVAFNYANDDNGRQSDAVSFGVTSGVIASHNWINGGQYANGCGLIADYKANNAMFLGNVVTQTYGCGIGIASGTNQLIAHNKVFITNGGPSAAGITLNGEYSPTPCGPVNLIHNVAYAINSGGWVQGYYDNGYCAPATLTSNIFDIGCTTGLNCTAYAKLEPLSTAHSPPAVPPVPKVCVIASPYSTQTSKPSCSSSTTNKQK